MKIFLIILSSILTLAPHAMGGESFEIGSRVLLRQEGVTACIGTVEEKSENYLKVDFDGEDRLKNCKFLGDNFLPSKFFEVAITSETESIGGFFGFWDTDFYIGDRVLVRVESSRGCSATIISLVNNYAQVEFDGTDPLSNCKFMEHYHIGLSAMEHLIAE